jgi:hypothetical protein
VEGHQLDARNRKFVLLWCWSDHQYKQRASFHQLMNLIILHL